MRLGGEGRSCSILLFCRLWHCVCYCKTMIYSARRSCCFLYTSRMWILLGYSYLYHASWNTVTFHVNMYCPMNNLTWNHFRLQLCMTRLYSGRLHVLCGIESALPTVVLQPNRLLPIGLTQLGKVIDLKITTEPHMPPAAPAHGQLTNENNDIISQSNIMKHPLLGAVTHEANIILARSAAPAQPKARVAFAATQIQLCPLLRFLERPAP